MAKHMRNSSRNNVNASKKGRIVAVALAGVLVLGSVGAGALILSRNDQSPGRPVATTTASSSQKKATPKQAKQTETKKAEPAKQAETKQAEQKQTQQPVKQAEPAKKAEQQPVKQAETKKPEQQSEPQSQPTPQQATPANDTGIEAKYSREQCIATACSYVGAGGAAKGPALNVVANGPVTGGGTVYYNVELNLGDVHYTVTVDAVSGNVISAESSHAGTRCLIDQNGEPIEGTEIQA